MFLETGFEPSTGLSYILLVECRADQLIDSAVVIIMLSVMASCCLEFTYCIICGECDINIGILKCCGDGSGFFSDVGEFHPVHFLNVFSFGFRPIRQADRG